MTVKNLIESGVFELVNEGAESGREITEPFCCDLLSIAMSRIPEGAAWVTVMANMNTLAVASLTDVSCIILAEGVGLDAVSVKKAKDEGITVFQTESSVFFAALEIYRMIRG